jgi:hypothetical protein
MKKLNSILVLTAILCFLLLIIMVTYDSKKEVETYDRLFNEYYSKHQFILKGVVKDKTYKSRDYGDIEISKISLSGNFDFNPSLGFSPSGRYFMKYSGGFYSRFEIGDTVTFNTYIRKVTVKKRDNQLLEHPL